MDYGYGTFASVGEDDTNRVNFGGHNKGITPIFFTVAEPNPKESELQGRAVYTTEERVHLMIAGDSFSVHSQPVDEGIKWRFPEAYKHWKQTNEGRQITGTPLKMWPLATPVQIKELEAINVFSVEDLANIADVHINRIPDGRVWRQRAQAWLETAAGTATATRFAAENERLRERLAALESKINATGIAETRPESADSFAIGSERGAEDGRSVASARANKREYMKAYWAKRKAEKAQADGKVSE